VHLPVEAERHPGRDDRPDELADHDRIPHSPTPS
jgi:hypothetical protein